ncbi:MAG TPA: chalcone isomerase family protein [Candidatus Solibacter sp.]|nr:chalcone isomerase family protein [Candidatus Solibacter sp.]
MRKTILFLTFAVFALLPISLYAGTLNNVTLPDTAQAGSTTLVLNGMGLRTKYMVKVYVAGLYVAQKSSDPTAILKADTPRRIVMHFVRDVSKSQLTDGFTESFNNNTPDAAKSLKTDVDRFFSTLEAIKDGEELVFTYIPGTGTTVSQAGKDKLTIAGPAFAEMLFSVWLGPKPPNAPLKKGLLGE